MIRTTEKAPPAATASLLARMTDKVVEMAENGVAVTADSLLEHSDFTRDEIRSFGAAACDAARQRSRRAA